ncbi:hypothetical protein MHC_00900 [Mycoplasma haemocanis str. Illinois]|uniref:Uncharacterized protein n=1 Tax=Mycoplasma haemocanis (strain Illinois) TaxID=1111676 RepID=H6N5T6_MYCHN|nr:hypothetical protein [Mycoplasma haemocanis]AEW45046.1 hypothetical protein MHC_00900 [Mycoplasma haemocanis str. Illinois]
MALSIKKVISAFVAGASGIVGIIWTKNSGKLNKLISSSPETTFTETRSIRDQIFKSGKKLLQTEANSKAWDVRKEQYQERFGGIITNEDVIQWCNSSLDNKYEDSLYKNVSELCSVPTMRERLIFNKKQIIDLKNKNDPKWGEKVVNYSKNQNNKMPNSELRTVGNSVTTEVIMNWCKDGVEEEFMDENERYNIVNTWCTSS